MPIEGWTAVDEDAGVYWREYRFRGPAVATTLVFRGVDGLAVVSPSMGMTSRDFDALAAHGPVRALIANNAYHHMGQADWRARFPEAVSYAPAGAMARLGKKSMGIPYRSLSELKLPAHVSVDEPPGFKTGNAFLRLRTKKGSVWYTGDLLTNLQEVPPPPLRWLFTWTGSAPGFRLFKLGVWNMVGDRKKLRAFMLERLASDPPSIVVPAHGPAVTGGDVAAQARAQIEKL